MNYEKFNERMVGKLDHQANLYKELLPHCVSPLYDLGCGRGTMLTLCRAADIEATGVDNDPSTVDTLRTEGFRVIERNVVQFLQDRMTDPVNTIFAAHIIEHFPKEYIQVFLQQCYNLLNPGGKLILLTPNVQSLWVHADTFYKDPTHVAPIHREVLVFLLQELGMTILEARGFSPIQEADKLEKIGHPGYDRNVDKLNQIIYGDLDSLVVAQR